MGTQPTKLVPTRANGQPAFGYYLQDPHAPIGHANGFIVLTLAGDKVCAITRFGDNSLFPHFGLPRTLEWSQDAHSQAAPTWPPGDDPI